MLSLTLAALVPAIALCIFVFIKDRQEKEPFKLLLLLFGAGILTIVPSVFCELIFEVILDSAFAGSITITESSTACVTAADYIYQFLNAFFGVALAEEFFKWLAMLIITKHSKHFNSLFDGMVYAVFVSLGFAALENVLYVFEGGLGVAIARMLLSVPAHMFFAMFMGFYYSMWNLNRKSNLYKALLMEKHNLTDNSRNPFPTKRFLALSLWVPVLVHGLYDFLLFTENTVCILIFIGVMVFLYIHCFKKIKKLSKQDKLHSDLAKANVFAKYPNLAAMEMQSEAENIYSNV